MDVIRLLDRCIALERAAGEIYKVLAARFAGDAELRGLWSGMADDEGAHAQRLVAWRRLAAAEPPEHRTLADGFDDAIDALERLLETSRTAAGRVASADEAFALALALETSELDAIYTKLMHSSPIARSSHTTEASRAEVARHHATLVRTVRARSRDEHNLLLAALLAAEDR